MIRCLKNLRQDGKRRMEVYGAQSASGSFWQLTHDSSCSAWPQSGQINVYSSCIYTVRQAYTCYSEGRGILQSLLWQAGQAFGVSTRLSKTYPHLRHLNTTTIV